MNDETKELLECAKINFENLAETVPALREHPFYVIAKTQLDEALGYHKGEVSMIGIKSQVGEPDNAS